jgi:hypothetical protein
MKRKAENQEDRQSSVFINRPTMILTSADALQQQTLNRVVRIIVLLRQRQMSQRSRRRCLRRLLPPCR